MERIKAGSNFHCLHFVYGVARSVDNPAEIEWRTPVGVVILDDEILGLL